MRLAVLDNGHRLRARLFLSTAVRLSGVEMSDVPKVLLYRPEFFGAPMLYLSAQMMRGRSFWTAAEREYMAMRTAAIHRCTYCVQTHTELVRIASTGEIDAADPASARAELTTVVALLETVTSRPNQVPAAEIRGVRNAGVPDVAVIDALHVNLIWNVINRLALAFDFRLRERQLGTGTRMLHRFSYRFPGFLTHTRGHTHRMTEPAEYRERLVARLRRSVFDSPAHTDPQTRAAAATGARLDDDLAHFAAKVRDNPHQITDTDIRALSAAGRSDDEIFEVTVAAALGAALSSLDAGLAALSAAPTCPSGRTDDDNRGKIT